MCTLYFRYVNNNDVTALVMDGFTNTNDSRRYPKSNFLYSHQNNSFPFVSALYSTFHESSNNNPLMLGVPHVL